MLKKILYNAVAVIIGMTYFVVASLRGQGMMIDQTQLISSRGISINRYVDSHGK